MVFEQEIPRSSSSDILKNYLRRTLTELLREVDSGPTDNDYIAFRLEQICDTLLRSGSIYQHSEHVLTLLRRALAVLQNSLLQDINTFPVVAVQRNGRPGRPCLDIPGDTLKLLLEFGFKVTEIGTMFSVNVRTIHRRLASLNIRADIRRYTDISDEQLDGTCRNITREFPNCGVRRMRGFLSATNIHVTWEKTRETMRRIDPEGVMIRSLQLNIVQRRVYYVRGPLHLWHIDGNHKLIR